MVLKSTTQVAIAYQITGWAVDEGGGNCVQGRFLPSIGSSIQEFLVHLPMVNQ